MRRGGRPLAARPQLSEELAKLLRDEIISGKRAPGERLPTEHQMAEHYGVSRAVVREAISKLKYDGLVDTRQGLGAFVGSTGRGTTFRIEGGDLTRRDLSLVFELRTTVEAEAAALAALRHTPEQMEAIRSSLARLQQSLGTEDDGAEADTAFHMAVADAAANHYFREFMDFLASRIVTSIAVARRNSARHSGWSDMVQTEHAAVCDAIEQGDAEGAREAMSTHLKNAARRLGLGDRP